jgi:phospholipase C
LKLIESTFGLQHLTARDANAQDLRQVLLRRPRRPVPVGAIPTSSQVLGPVSDAAAICSAASVPSVSPPPVHGHHRPDETAAAAQGAGTGISGAGMVAFGHEYRGTRDAVRSN